MNQDERLGLILDSYRKHFGTFAEVVIDAGTRDGHDAKFLANELWAKTVVAIDANPIAIKKTRENYPEFIVVETALANYEGVAEFDQIVSDREDYAGSSSLARYAKFAEAKHNTIRVNVTTMTKVLDQYLPNVATLDVVKVDVEGYSYEFLEGMGDYLDRVKLIQLETETFHRHEGHKNSYEVRKFLEGRGFLLEAEFYEWGKHMPELIYINPALTKR